MTAAADGVTAMIHGEEEAGATEKQIRLHT
jgi:hypothetical protein